MGKMDDMHITWRKASYSGYNGNCVEVRNDSMIHVRDTKDPDPGKELTFTPKVWAEFLSAIKKAT